MRLLFWRAATAERILTPQVLRDTAWHSWTLLGVPVAGGTKMSDGTDIHSAHRSPDGRLLVTCDEFRKVNLFRHPCGPGSAACRSIAPHASHVAAVRFTADGYASSRWAGPTSASSFSACGAPAGGRASGGGARTAHPGGWGRRRACVGGAQACGRLDTSSNRRVTWWRMLLARGRIVKRNAGGRELGFDLGGC